jgi:hypothetical protein
LKLKISIEEKKGDNIEKYVENKLHIKVYFGIKNINQRKERGKILKKNSKIN